jgi:hypothetical protein
MEDRRDLQELEVILSVDPYNVTAKHELGVSLRAEIVAGVPPDGDDVEDLQVAFVEAIKNLRHGLALAGVLGKMQLYYDSMFSKESEEAANRAIDTFTEEDLAVTNDAVVAAHREEAEVASRAVQRLEEMVEFTVAQSEEGENLTLGEARKRQEEGTERLRRIAKGQGED